MYIIQPTLLWSIIQPTLNKSERRVSKRISSRSSSINCSNTGEGKPRVQPKRSAGREATITDSNGAHTLSLPHSNIRRGASPNSWPDLENWLCSSQLLTPFVHVDSCVIILLFCDESPIDSSLSATSCSKDSLLVDIAIKPMNLKGLV